MPFKNRKMKNKVIDLFGNNKIVPNSGVKYSTLLEQFMDAFMADFKDYEYIEDIIAFAINAWNFGNIKTIIPPEEFDKTLKDNPNTDIDFSLLNRMINYKAEKFKKYTNFIADFELTEVNDGSGSILSVMTQKQDAYLANMFEQIDEETNAHSGYDFEENYIDRLAIILKPLQPCIDWHNSLYPDSKIDETNVDETNIYLVDDEIEDIEKWLKKKFDRFFMMELDQWHTNKKEWPQRRNYKMFKQWFRVETSHMIYDLEKRPVLKSE